jgi:hypothetical protein
MSIAKVGPLLHVYATRPEAEAGADADARIGKTLVADGVRKANAVVVDEIQRADGSVCFGVWLGVHS